MITSKLAPYLIEQANNRAMQSLNVVLPDKEDFQRWIKEVKQEIILELRKEIVFEREPEPEYLTRKEIAERFKISLVTLHHLTVRGLPSLKVGKRRVYDCKAVEKYLKSKK
jgi:Helix-turn-helix domain